VCVNKDAGLHALTEIGLKSSTCTVSKMLSKSMWDLHQRKAAAAAAARQSGSNLKSNSASKDSTNSQSGSSKSTNSDSSEKLVAKDRAIANWKKMIRKSKGGSQPSMLRSFTQSMFTKPNDDEGTHLAYLASALVLI